MTTPYEHLITATAEEEPSEPSMVLKVGLAVELPGPGYYWTVVEVLAELFGMLEREALFPGRVKIDAELDWVYDDCAGVQVKDL
jgi:hypothetical protein